MFFSWIESFYKKKPIETFYLNSEVCKIFLELAKKKKAKFIFFSSSEIYGNPDMKNIPTKEIYEGRVSSVGDRSCYDESKRAGETRKDRAAASTEGAEAPRSEGAEQTQGAQHCGRSGAQSS